MRFIFIHYLLQNNYIEIYWFSIFQNFERQASSCWHYTCLKLLLEDCWKLAADCCCMEDMEDCCIDDIEDCWTEDCWKDWDMLLSKKYNNVSQVGHKKKFNITFIIIFFGSGALSGLILDLGLLKVILGKFFLSYPLPNPAGQSWPLLNLP